MWAEIQQAFEPYTKKETMQRQQLVQILKGNQPYTTCCLYGITNEIFSFHNHNNEKALHHSPFTVHADIKFFGSDGFIDNIAQIFDYSAPESAHGLDHHRQFGNCVR